MIDRSVHAPDGYRTLVGNAHYMKLIYVFDASVVARDVQCILSGCGCRLSPAGISMHTCLTQTSHSRDIYDTGKFCQAGHLDSNRVNIPLDFGIPSNVDDIVHRFIVINICAVHITVDSATVYGDDIITGCAAFLYRYTASYDPVIVPPADGDAIPLGLSRGITSDNCDCLLSIINRELFPSDSNTAADGYGIV